MGNDAEEIDLLQELQRATELKNSPMQPISNNSEINTEASPDSNQDSQPGTDQKPLDQFEDDFSPEVNVPAPGEALTTLTYSAEKTADIIIEGIDTLFEHGLPALYANSFSKDDRRSLKALAAKYRQTKSADTLTLNENDQRLMEIYCDYEEYKKMCPMDEDEKKSLKAPLIEVLKKQNYQTTPETALIISASIITLPRLIPVLKNMYDTN